MSIADVVEEFAEGLNDLETMKVMFRDGDEIIMDEFAERMLCLDQALVHLCEVIGGGVSAHYISHFSAKIRRHLKERKVIA